jgi:hypothetical protein
MKPIMILRAFIAAVIIIIAIIINQSKQQTIELEEINCKTNKEVYMTEFPFVFFSS